MAMIGLERPGQLANANGSVPWAFTFNQGSELAVMVGFLVSSRVLFERLKGVVYS